MAKTRHDKPEESKAPLILMTAGGLAVAGLVAWALTRTVEPAPAAVAGSTPPALEQPVAPPAAGFPATGDTATPSVLPTHEERTHVARISVEDAHAKFGRGEVTMIDVRDAGSYAAGHVKGAINIPFAQVESRVAEIPKGKAIVTYCTWPAEESSAGAALIMKSKGIENVSALYGGFHAWESNGYPTEKQ